MIQNAILYVLRKKKRTCILFIILTTVLSFLYSSLNIMKLSNNLENDLYKISNTSISITQKDNQNFEINQFKEMENIQEIKEIISQYNCLAKATNVEVVAGIQKVERENLPEILKNTFSIESTNSTKNNVLFNSGIFTIIDGRHIEKNDREKSNQDYNYEEIVWGHNLIESNIEVLDAIKNLNSYEKSIIKRVDFITIGNRDMDCKQVEKMIPQFLDDDLTTEELREFMEHIENCTDCKEELTIEFLVSEGLVRLENGAVFDLQKELSECIASAERHLHWRENVHMFLYILEGLVAVEAITVAALFVFLK